jgi:DNA-binding SARP family transcriptional activator
MTRPLTAVRSYPGQVKAGGGRPGRAGFDRTDPRGRSAAAPPAGPGIRFRLLGPVEVTVGSRTVTPRAHKVRVLLAALLVRSGTVVPVESLIQTLWGETSPRTALQATRVYISQLRQVLAGAPEDRHRPNLATLPAGYRLDLDESMLDTLEFQSRCRLARRLQDEGKLELAATQYRLAAALWRGPALADVRSVAQLEGAAIHLEEACIAALERRIDLELRLNRHLDLIAELFALTAEHPLHESLHARLMIALHRAGRTGDALGVYRSLRNSLVGELGVEPGRKLQSVHQAVLAADADNLDISDLWTL